MANNRMFLVNDRLGVRVFLAKYYPSTGWYSPAPDIAGALSKAFEADDTMGADPGSGPTDWRLAYESDDGFRYDTHRQITAADES